MNTLLIGDIHGCYHELLDLLDKAGLASGDRIIALGDIVDRGPHSPEVLAFFRDEPSAQSLQGNHERKHVRSARGETRAALSQVITRVQIGENAYPEACTFMSGLPQSLELPEAIAVHGMFEPGVALASQRDTVLLGTLSGEHYLKQRLSRPWYELYEGEKPLVVGHHCYLGDGTPLVVRDRVYCIDTGCCHGLALTGLLLPSFRLIQVQSRKDYWEEAQREYYDLRFSQTPDQELSWEAAEAMVLAARSGDMLPPDVEARRTRLESMLSLAEQRLRALMDYLLELNATAMERLRARHAVDQLSPQKLGSLYARQIGESPFAGLLHKARRGELTLEVLRKHYPKPAQVPSITPEAPADGERQ